MINNLGIFLFAGMDTVSTTLSNTMYILMKYPDEMRKLQEEIDVKFDFTLEVIIKLLINSICFS